MRRARSLGIAFLLAAGCGRGQRPAPAVQPVIPPDSLVRVNPDSAARVPASVVPPVTPPSAAKAAPGAAERPAERCILDLENTPDTRSQFIKDPVSGKYTTYIGGGVVGNCRRQDITIVADSAESYEQNQLYFLIGRVKYREKRVALDADRISYFRAEERLLAEGNVRAVLQDSSTMVGPRAEYFRAIRGLRPRARIVATSRPTLTLVEKDSLGRKRGEPVTLIADNINGEGDSLFVAWGRVELDRSDIRARGDSAQLDNIAQSSRLMKAPFIESKGKDPFTLKGRVIDLFGQTRRVDRVLAMDSAVAVNNELTLASDTIDLRVKDDQLQRAFAFGPNGASAVTQERTILADSLDVYLPGQRIREMHAVGDAYAETDPDSNKVASEQRDWLRGDTIVARFDSLASTDTSSRPAIKSLVSSGSARSFYQVPANDGEKGKPGINYVRGRQIVVDFADRDVRTVTVIDSTSGVYLEPQSDSVAQASAQPRPANRPRQGNQPARRPTTPIRRPPQ